MNVPIKVRTGISEPTIGTTRLASDLESAAKKARSAKMNVAPDTNALIKMYERGHTSTHGIATSTASDKIPTSPAYVALRLNAVESKALSTTKATPLHRWPMMAKINHDIGSIVPLKKHR